METIEPMTDQEIAGGAFFLWTWALIVVSLALGGCEGAARAQTPPSPYSMACTHIQVGLASNGQRCENEEAVCYVRGEALSCFRK